MPEFYDTKSGLWTAGWLRGNFDFRTTYLILLLTRHEGNSPASIEPASRALALANKPRGNTLFDRRQREYNDESIWVFRLLTNQ